MKLNRVNSKKGQATLSLAILVGGTAVLVGLLLAFLALSFLNAAASFQASNRALALASAGAEDALLRLTRDKNLNMPIGYEINFGTDKATVQVSNNQNGQAIITSTAQVLTVKKRLKVIAGVDPATSKVSVSSWTQQAF